MTTITPARLSCEVAPSRRVPGQWLTRAAQVFIALWVLFYLIQGLGVTLAFDGAPVNGPFQLYNPLRRIAAGQVPGRDFVFFHGIGVPYLHYPLFALFGGKTLTASELSRQWTSILLFVTSLAAFSWAALRRSARVWVGMAVAIMVLEVLFPGGAAPGHSLVSGRSTMPVIAFALLQLRLRDWFKAVLVGCAISLAFLLGTEHAISLSLALIAVSGVSILQALTGGRAANVVGRNIRFTALALATAAGLTALLLVSAAGGRGSHPQGFALSPGGVARRSVLFLRRPADAVPRLMEGIAGQPPRDSDPDANLCGTRDSGMAVDPVLEEPAPVRPGLAGRRGLHADLRGSLRHTALGYPQPALRFSPCAGDGPGGDVGLRRWCNAAIPAVCGISSLARLAGRYRCDFRRSLHCMGSWPSRQIDGTDPSIAASAERAGAALQQAPEQGLGYFHGRRHPPHRLSSRAANAFAVVRLLGAARGPLRHLSPGGRLHHPRGRPPEVAALHPDLPQHRSGVRNHNDSGLFFRGVAARRTMGVLRSSPR